MCNGGHDIAPVSLESQNSVIETESNRGCSVRNGVVVRLLCLVAVPLSHKWTQGVLVALRVEERRKGSSSVIAKRRGSGFSCQRRCCMR